MPARKISGLLAASTELRAISAQARRLAELQQAYLASAPPQLAKASRVSHCRAGTLVLSAGNAATAAKLRQCAPSLLASIQKQEPQITGIRVEVQVMEPPRTPRSGREKGGLPVETVEDFRKLAQQVSNPGLKSALARLVRRHSGRG